jgi:hypothetical protein
MPVTPMRSARSGLGHGAAKGFETLPNEQILPAKALTQLLDFFFSAHIASVKS